MRLLFLGLSILSSVVFAADKNCGGKITLVMGDHSACGGHMAFKTEASNTKWMCTKSNEAGSIVLTALTAGKETAVYIDDSRISTCPDLPHYRKISYVIIYP
ncbi:hypothetical protein [Vibrio penaeicida]|uniref:hypothetical protein n=1 Tax=Vibrio penaeicida TaxID=104609 RepID=UPI000CEA0174|nr:hypothetical protein [Vibrio penaeicida]